MSRGSSFPFIDGWESFGLRQCLVIGRGLPSIILIAPDLTSDLSPFASLIQPQFRIIHSPPKRRHALFLCNVTFLLLYVFVLSCCSCFETSKVLLILSWTRHELSGWCGCVACAYVPLPRVFFAVQFTHLSHLYIQYMFLSIICLCSSEVFVSSFLWSSLSVEFLLHSSP